VISADEAELAGKMRKYKWFHAIKISDNLYTEPAYSELQTEWDFDLECISSVDFSNKRVLDIGCRDGRWSFEAEKRGAREVIGIDNDLSRGAVEFLIPLFNSKVKMHEMNLYELTPDKFGSFDIIIFFGILYHLRYPFWGLKKAVDCLSDGGLILIESGMLVSKELEKIELLYCPVEKSPYEVTSCSFFNKEGLDVTLRSLNCELLNSWTFSNKKECKKISVCDFFRRLAKIRINKLIKRVKILIERIKVFFSRKEIKCRVTRQVFIFRKNLQMWRNYDKKELYGYWNEIHSAHTQWGLEFYFRDRDIAGARKNIDTKE